jgi:hypothetical protein
MQGRGRGGGRGQGAGGGRGGGMGQGRGAGGLGMGGSCLCPKCGRRQDHQPGVPCMELRCPECGTALVREGSPHHQEIDRRRAEGTDES